MTVLLLLIRMKVVRSRAKYEFAQGVSMREERGRLMRGWIWSRDLPHINPGLTPSPPKRPF